MTVPAQTGRRTAAGKRNRRGMALTIAWWLLGAMAARAEETTKLPLAMLQPTDRILVQRGFVPVRDEKRLYACVVGSPAQIHYAYDFATAAILAVWRGPFADVSEMWEGRAFNQTARPAGKVLALGTRPLLAFFPDRLLDFPKAWPTQPDPLYSTEGYELEPDGQPVFLARMADVTLRDRIAIRADRRGLERRIELGGKPPLWETWLLLAEAETLGALPSGEGWEIGERGWILEWPKNSVHKPVLRRAATGLELVLRIEKTHFKQPVEYSLLW
jgi:hypothetical protein